MKKIFITLLSIAAMLPARSQDVPAWLKDAAIYHIYPSSYKDSDGDGIGDINGIRSKLDYIGSLGVTAIWISPCFCSEFKDGGYDITDFYTVDPRFGTNSELVALFREARAKGIRVCLDLVAGHTSSEHPWFKQSMKGEDLQYSDYFIWTGDRNVKPKSFVESDSPRGNYMKNFFDCQPALNYGYLSPDPSRPWEQSMDAPGPTAVRNELKNIISFWMDKGASGFRVDMAPSLVKGDDKNRSGVMALWADLRPWFSGKYPEGVLLSEWSVPHEAIKAGFHIDLMIHNKEGGKIYRPLVCNSTDKGEAADCYFDRAGKGSIADALKVYEKEYKATRDLGYATMPTSSHDIWRLNRNGRSTPEEQKVILTFFLTMPWPPIIYYGEEIGMRSMEDAPIKEGSLTARNRSSCRTPMQWTAGTNAGFSAADPAEIYLPIDPSPEFPNVEAQENDPASVLNYVRGLLRLRREVMALSTRGDWSLVSDPSQPYPMVYARTLGDEKVIVVLNPSGRKATCDVQSLGGTAEYLYGTGKQPRIRSVKGSDRIDIGPVSSAVYKIVR